MDSLISTFSQRYSVKEPLIEGETHYGHRVAAPGRMSLEAEHLVGHRPNRRFSVRKRSVMTQKDRHSVQLSGLMVQKNMRTQTVTQYDLVPEVIYNNLKARLNDLVVEIAGPTITRCQALEEEI